MDILKHAKHTDLKDHLAHAVHTRQAGKGLFFFLCCLLAHVYRNSDRVQTAIINLSSMINF